MRSVALVEASLLVMAVEKALQHWLHSLSQVGMKCRRKPRGMVFFTALRIYIHTYTHIHSTGIQVHAFQYESIIIVNMYIFTCGTQV